MYEYFGFAPEIMAPKIKDLVEKMKRDGITFLRGDFRDGNSTLRVGCEPE